MGWINHSVLHIVWFQLISVEWSIPLHCVSERSSEHVFATAGILRKTKLMERWQLLNIYLFVVGERNRWSITWLYQSIWRVTVVVYVIQHIVMLVVTIFLGCL